jgi:hypothetical protein
MDRVSQLRCGRLDGSCPVVAATMAIGYPGEVKSLAVNA